MATNFRVKIGKIGLFTFIRSAGISKRIAISPFRLMKVCLGDLATPCVNMVNFRSINSGVYEGERYAPVVSFL